MLKVNLASGNKFEDSWVNVDSSILYKLSKMKFPLFIAYKLGLIEKSVYTFNVNKQKWPKKMVEAKIRKKLPFRTDSVDFLFCADFLEHFTPKGAEVFLRECRRVLSKKGTFRIIVPDLEAFVKAYAREDYEFFGLDKSKSTKEDISTELNGIFYRMTYLKKKGYAQTWLMDLFSDPNKHKWMYDYASLSSVLQKAGFKNVKRMQPGEGKTPNLNVIDHFDNKHLIVECQK